MQPSARTRPVDRPETVHRWRLAPCAALRWVRSLAVLSLCSACLVAPPLASAQQQQPAAGATGAPGVDASSGTAASAGTAGAAGNAGAAGTANSAGGSTPARGAGNAEPLRLGITCIAVKDVSVFERFRRSVAKTLSTEEDVARQARDPRTEPKPTETDAVCSGDSNDSTDAILSGVGTVRIGLDAISFAALERQEKETNKRATLFLNGIDLGSDARRAGVYRTNERAYLTYQLTPGSNTGTLWRTLYAAGSIQEAHPLSVALGWDGIPARRNASVAAWTNDPTLAITTPPIFLTALVVMFVLIAASLALAWYGDALRDSKTPDFYREAMAQRAVARAKGASDAGLKALAAEYGVGDGTTLPDPGTVERWSTAAERAWTQEEPTSAEAIRAATLGAIFRSAPLGPAPRASYSLARVQLAVWFTFTVACALYLWIVFGTLPAISGSALALLGISIGTAAASVTIDQSHQGRPFKPSAGFFRDLTTGFDDKPHVYRYQAIVVNALLLLTGIYQVLDELKFPTFDSTWLAFLGLSGLTQAIGKQITDPPAGAPTAALAGAKPK